MLLRSKRYYCQNVKICKYASRDYVYSKGDFEKGRGLCIGKQNDGCNSQLVEGISKDWRPLFAIFILVAIAGLYRYGNTVLTIIFPPAISGVTFASPITTFYRSAPVIAIKVLRSGDLSGRTIVRYSTEPLNADEPNPTKNQVGDLIFQPGEAQTELALLYDKMADANDAKRVGVLVIRLLNVDGLPTHKVVIDEPPVDKEALQNADVLVHAISPLVMDIASFYVKSRALRTLLRALPSNSSDLQKFSPKLEEINANLVRARERYLQLISELSRLDPKVALQAIDKLIVSLSDQGLVQQHDVTVIMKRQLQSLLDHNSVEMDLWVEQLGSAIPQKDFENTNSAKITL